MRTPRLVAKITPMKRVCVVMGGHFSSAIIGRVRAKYPQARIVLAGMQAPPTLGPDYAEAFSRIFPEVAREQQATLVPFLLEGVGGEPAFNQSDQIHPNPAGHRRLAANVWSVVRPLLEAGH